MEAVDAAVEELVEEKADDKEDVGNESLDKKKDSDEVQETTFDNPSPEEIKELQAEPKDLSDKKKEKRRN